MFFGAKNSRRNRGFDRLNPIGGSKRESRSAFKALGSARGKFNANKNAGELFFFFAIALQNYPRARKHFRGGKFSFVGLLDHVLVDRASELSGTEVVKTSSLRAPPRDTRPLFPPRHIDFAEETRYFSPSFFTFRSRSVADARISVPRELEFYATITEEIRYATVDPRTANRTGIRVFLTIR